MKDDVVVQIIGTRKSAATRKAIRFFSDRGVKAHLVDLNERGLKRGEIENIARVVDVMELIDTGSPAYRSGGFAYLDFDPVEELLERPLLMKMPVVRYGRQVAVGENPAEWKRWLSG